MKNAFELFFQTNSNQCRRLGHWPTPPAPSLLTDHLIAAVEQKMAPLLREGADPARFTLNLQSGRSFLDLEVSPLMFARLSALGLQFAIQTNPVSNLEKICSERRKVGIRRVDILADSETLGEDWRLEKLAVTVNLTDESLWEAEFYTLDHLKQALEVSRQQKDRAPWFSGHNYVVMEQLNRQGIEKSIAALFHQGRFEQVFRRVDGLEKLDPDVDTQLLLRVLHPSQNRQAIAEALKWSDWRAASGERCSFFMADFPGQQPDNPFLHDLLDKVQARRQYLASLGVGRQDLSLQIQYRYRFQGGVHLSPASIARLRQQGLNLTISLAPKEVVVARCLD